MAKKNQEFGKNGYGKPRSVKNPNNANNKCVNGFSPPHINNNNKGEMARQRLSPVRRTPSATNSQGSSPRTSPGLLGGYYAGCKWNEPPLPSALPLPPQHWMMMQNKTSHAVLHPHHYIGAANHNMVHQQPDIAQQLKVLLKVQA